MRTAKTGFGRSLGILAVAALFGVSAAAFDGSAISTGSRAETLDACVAPTDDMRRNHMEYIQHQRDRTVHQGIRGSKFSLAGCVNCHGGQSNGTPVAINAEGQFCQECHEYTAVSIDCFQCHRSTPEETAAASQSNATPNADLHSLANRRRGDDVTIPAQRAIEDGRKLSFLPQEDRE